MPFGSLFSHRVPQGHTESAGSEHEGYAVHQRRGQEFSSVGQFEQAINQYTLGLKAQLTEQQEGALLLGRGCAFASLSERLRSIPAAHSEAHAVIGLDPTHLAQLALRDSTRALTLLKPQPDPYALQGTAYMLLEQYSEAESTLLEGLAEDPTHIGLQNALRQAAAASAEALVRSPMARKQLIARVDEVECTLCLKLLFEPVTTSCGHTFCRPCFLRAQDHGSRCPMCRTVLHIGRELPVTVTLKNILEKSFPIEYAERRAEENAASTGRGPGECVAEPPVPLFVMSCLMPGEKMALNIFEPRYRLMVRRCMEGNRRFGMATVSGSHQLDAVACLAEILDCQPLPDGRFYLEIVGRRRFRIADTWEQDGYRMARPDYYLDSVPSSQQEAQALVSLAQHVESLADQWAERFRAMVQAGNRDRFMLQMLAAAADKPPVRAATAGDGITPEMAEVVSFWVAGMIPLAKDKRLRLMEMTSSTERLLFVQGVLQAHDSPGCAVQ